MTVVVELSAEEGRKLLRAIDLPRARWGGFQTCIDAVQRGAEMTPSGWRFTMSETTARRVLRYSRPQYGKGTYQEQLRALAPAVAVALADLDRLQTALFEEGGDP